MPSTTFTFTTASSVGSGVAWSNPENALASDNDRATSAGLDSSAPDSQALRLVGLVGDLDSIPFGAIITGVELNVEGSHQGIAATAKITSAQLVLTNTNIGEIDTTDHPMGSADATHVYGSSATNWGYRLTKTNLVDSTFGAEIVCTHVTGASVTARIDYVSMTVYWNYPGGRQGLVVQKDRGGRYTGVKIMGWRETNERA